MKIKILLIGLLFTCSTLLMGCEHTVKGFGKDMQDNGEKIESSASK